MPYFSIIIVSLNASLSIKKTIDSVLGQNFDDYEIIVKDGGSQDETLKKIPNDKRIRIFVKKDNNLYDAMNQATDYAKGNFTIYMNCGDTFYNESVLFQIYRISKEEKTESVIYGNAYFKSIDKIKYYPKRLTNYFWYRTTICHQAVFISRELLQRERYNLDYSIVADYDLLLNLYLKKVNFIYANLIICTYEGGGISDTKKGIMKRKEEKRLVLRKRFNFLARFLFFCFHCFLYFRQRLKEKKMR